VSKEPEVIVSNEPWKKPLPNIDKDNEEWYEGLKQHKFLVWRCKQCGASYWPKAYCINHENEPFAANMEWAPASGRGKIFAFNKHHMAFHPGFAKEVGAALQPGGSALVLIVRQGTPELVLSALRPYEGQVYQTTLSPELEQELRQALQH